MNRSLQLRKLTGDDWDECKRWYGRRVPPPGRAPIETGFVVETCEGVLAATGFLILTNCEIAWAEFFETNPELPGMTQALALKRLAAGICEVAKCSGFSYIMGIVRDEDASLARVYEKLGGVQEPTLKRQIIKRL